ncbi:Ig-like domain-containing protein [Halomonas elongata]|uniref:Ig-like domain-containing protein n=1 Tax=Halomonas elongata TaxID=2746 RepID=UPI0023AEE3F3|nr:VCBS domain-containing protein [Halomonas elongata]
MTINGATDGPPTVDIDDNAPNAEGADHSVVEATGNTISGTATVGAEAGIDSVTVNGTDITDASNTPVSFQGDEGTLTITGYDAATGEITYDYTEDGDAEDHGNGEILDRFDLEVTDLAGESTTDSLDIRIEDTEPSADDDSAEVGEDDTSPATGNVLDNDTESADTPSGVVFTDTGASYGSFVDNGDGSWSYQVDTTNGAVQALDDGDTLTETFEYTLTDADGDTSTATLTVTLNGATDGPPTVDIDDNALNVEGADHSVVEATGNTISGTATVGAEAGIDSVTVDGQDITDASNNPVTLQGDEGTLTITGYDAATGEITYDYTEDGDAEDHGSGEILDQFTLGVTDLAGESTTDSLDIRIEDTEPAASDDTAAIGEDDTSPATGNVLDNDTESADTPSAISFDADDVAAAQYGSFVDNGDGSWSYQVDTTNGAVQALDDDEFLTETFEYTLTDADGDTSTATLTVTINGATDGPPTVDIDDNAPNAEGADHSVVEATGNTISGSATVGAEAGIDSVTVNGSDITDASNTPVTLQGDEGTLTITGYNAATGEITYDYTEDGDAEDHSGGEILDQFTLGVTDLAGESTTDSLDIRIEDTEPAASDDSAAIGEDATSPVTGNVLDNDTESADTPSGVVFTDTGASYGSFVDNGDGSWSYQVDTTNGAVQALDDDEFLTETFEYTLTDADGDTSTATLTVTLNGATDGPPTVDIDDNAPNVEGADHSVVEATGNTISGTATVGAEAGIDSVTVNGSDITDASNTPVTLQGDEGTLTITGYNAATGEITYDYTEDGDAEDHSGGEILDQFTLGVTDLAGESTTDSLDIRIEDTEPAASDDSAAIGEDATSPVTGNVLGNDTESADTPSEVVFTDTSASYGSFVDNGDGSWSYQVDTTNGAVQALNDGEFLTETFEYTLTDADGDTSTATLTVTLNGATDGPPTVDIDDNAPNAEGADHSVVEATGNTISGSATVGAEAGIDSVTVNGSDITDASNTPVTLQGDEGTLTITGYDAATGEITYDYTEDGDAEDHGNGEILDRFDLEVTDVAGESSEDTLDIRIEDTEPAASDDSAAIGEDDTSPATGNVLDNDTESADTPSAINFDADDVAAAQYGSFVDNGDGSWSYQVDTTNGAVQALDDGEALTETFEYTLTDADGDTSTATLTVTLNGATDGPPTVDIDDNAPNAEGADHSVVEATGNTISGSATVGAEAGIDSVTVDGQDITDASNNPVTLQGDEGTLTITGYDAATGEITYDYTEEGDAEDHSAGEILDQFTLGVTDLAGESTTDSLDIRIEDTEPAASDDSAAIGEDATSPATGNVLDNDTESADTPSEVVFTDTSASYGSFVDNGDGSWSYQVDTTNGAVQALDDGETLTETFEYTLTDADGDTSTATLTVTINGQTDGPPTVDIDDNAPNVEGADHSVVEATGNTISGTATVGAEAGIDSVTVNGTDITDASNTPVTLQGDEGTLTITGYNAATGEISYDYTEDGDAENHGDGEIFDRFDLEVTDLAGESTSDSLDIRIEDTEPEASDDSTTTEEDTSVTYNVLANDDQGADGSTVTSASLATASEGTGTVSFDENTGEVTFAPASGFEGDVVIDYTITDADGDTSSAQLHVTVNEDSKPVLSALEGSDGVVDEAGLQDGSRPGDGSNVTSGTFGATVGNDSPSNLTIGGVNANGGGVFQGEYGTLEVTDNGDGEYGWTYTLTDNSTEHFSQGTGIDGVQDVFDIELADSEGDTTSGALNIDIIDDVPSVGTPTGQVSVAVSEQSIGDLEARWENVTTTGNWWEGRLKESEGGEDGISMTWGGTYADQRSGYDFEYADGVNDAAGVPTDALFSLGTLTHNNFPIYNDPQVLDTVDLVVEFTVEIDGVPTSVETTIALEHTETPNTGSDHRDIMRIANPDQEQMITVGDREFVLSIEGFRDANGDLVDTVRTYENGSTSFDLYAKVSSTDDLPTASGTIADDIDGWGADDQEEGESLVWQGGVENGVIQGEYGEITVAEDGSYTYELSRDVRDGMDVGETLTESFTYTLTDDDGDQVQGTLELTLNGEANNVQVNAQAASPRSLNILNFEEFSLAPEGEGATTDVAASENDGATEDAQEESVETTSAEVSGEESQALQAEDLLSDGDEDLFADSDPVGPPQHAESSRHHGQEGKSVGPGHDEKVVDIPHNPIE